VRVINRERLANWSFRPRIESACPDTAEAIDVRELVQDVTVRRPLRLLLDDIGMVQHAGGLGLLLERAERVGSREYRDDRILMAT